jgi:hypothetical protein
MAADLLNYIYRDSKDIYLKQLELTSSYSARATFIFGHNPRTADYTHVGAAEMLAGISQAAYALTHRYQPELIKDENIAGCFFKDISIKFSKMLAPNAAADLNINNPGLSLSPSPGPLPRHSHYLKYFEYKPEQATEKIWNNSYTVKTIKALTPPLSPLSLSLCKN